MIFYSDRKRFFLLVISSIIIFSCDSDTTPLAEKEAIHYCECASSLAKVTKELLNEKANYRLEDSLKIEERMGALSRKRSRLTTEMDACINDPKFQRYKDRAFQKMTPEEIEDYLAKRVETVMKHCPEVAETLNSFKR